MSSKFQPVIKWTGSKRSQANEILKYIPKHRTYFEPFLGGGAIMYAVAPETGVCGDICEPLIELWKVIQNDPMFLIDDYEKKWNLLQKDYKTFFEVRKRFNDEHKPEDLLFLSRTCVNGLIRFNQNGEFNNSLHYTRKGISPDKLKNIILDWSKRIQGIQFLNGDYKQTTSAATKEDFLYLDPPYFCTKGRYYAKKTIDFEEFFTYLESLNSKGIKFALSFDGKRGDTDYSVILPKHLYKKHVIIKSGLSSFKKVMDKTNDQVYESLYLNFDV